ncbi:MAG: hypothetical protein MRY64_13295 [Hyphomonadaceae bacterium]|nr:hypothetical protein [Hyphomonadaceae bacterium]
MKNAGLGFAILGISAFVTPDAAALEEGVCSTPGMLPFLVTQDGGDHEMHQILNNPSDVAAVTLSICTDAREDVAQPSTEYPGLTVSIGGNAPVQSLPVQTCMAVRVKDTVTVASNFNGSASGCYLIHD